MAAKKKVIEFLLAAEFTNPETFEEIEEMAQKIAGNPDIPNTDFTKALTLVRAFLMPSLQESTLPQGLNLTHL